MNIKKALLLCLLVLLSLGLASAEEEFNPPEELRPFYEVVFHKFRITDAALETARQQADTQLVEALEAELEVHLAYYNYLQDLPQDTETLQEDEMIEDYGMSFWVYHYRTEKKDYRPWDEVNEEEFVRFIEETCAANERTEQRNRALNDFRGQLMGSANP